MDKREQLNTLRQRINAIDDALVSQFCERMALSERIAMCKQEQGLPILDSARELQVVARAAAQAPGREMDISLLMRCIMSLSRKQQRNMLCKKPLALLPPPAAPAASTAKHIVSAYCDSPGASGEQACFKLFPQAQGMLVSHAEDVCLCVRDGRANYGVIAIGNAQTGSIVKTCELAYKHGCFIMGRTSIASGQSDFSREAADSSANCIHYAAIARQPEYNGQSNLISILCTIQGKGGAFYEALLPLMAADIPLLHIQAHPVGDGGSRLFLELSGNIMDPATAEALRQCAIACACFHVIGCYQQI